VVFYLQLLHQLFNFLKSADAKYFGISDGRYDVTEEISEQLTSIDTGVCFHLEYKLKDEPHAMSVSLRYYLGLQDLYEDNAGDAVTNRVFTLLASIPITGGESDE